MNKRLWIACVCLLLASGIASGQKYVSAGTIQIGGNGGWDYLQADEPSRRLYVSHSAEVAVIDMDSLKRVGTLDGFEFIHGIVLPPGLHKGFVSDGRKNKVFIFDPKTLLVTGSIDTAANPNSMVFDARSHRLFVGHKPSKSMTAIDPVAEKSIGTIQLEGVPEFPVADNSGTIFVNIDDKAEIARIDTSSMKVLGYWPVAGCERPSGMAIDRKRGRLFSTCRNGVMAIVDSKTGKLMATVPIGLKPDAARFDDKTGLAFASCGDGTLTVIERTGDDHYSVAQKIKTEVGARTMALDSKTGKIFVSTTEMISGSGHSAPSPNSFHVLEFEKVHAKK